MIDKYDMKIVNKEQEICKGLWTRGQGCKESKDYVIIQKIFYNHKWDAY